MCLFHSVMASFMKSTTGVIQLNKSRALLLFLLVCAITLFILHQIYSYSGGHVIHILPSTKARSGYVGRNLEFDKSTSTFEGKEIFPESSLPQLSNRSTELPSVERNDENLDFSHTARTGEDHPPASSQPQLGDTSPPQPPQQSNQVSEVLPMSKYHNLSSDSCPTVHIVMVVSSYGESRTSFLAIKSILMYRQTKIHFHFITDSIAQTILGPMMSSWLIPGVEFDFYNTTEAWNTTPWRNCQLCSKELLKIAALHLVLPHEIDAVVVVDPNLIITTSVSELFHQTLTDLGQKGKLIALGSNECTVQCTNGSVMQRNRTNTGHTTQGVMVLNLAGMRSSVPWRKMWESKKSEPPDISSVTSLKVVREVSTTLRCDWNTYEHLPSTVPEDCWANISVFEQQQLKSNTLRRILQRIQNYDGYQLRFKEKKNCYHSDPHFKKPPSSASKTDKCIMLKWQGTARRRIYPYLLAYNYTSSDPHDVALVGHLNLKRFHLVEKVSRHWDGPMSLAIHVADSEVEKVIDLVSKSEILSLRKNIAYHLLFKIGPCYPINPMRIMGHKFAAMPYVFFNDMDFIPSYGLYNNLKDIIKNIDDMEKTALVVPAFETSHKDFNYPRNKQEMVSFMQRKLVKQFHNGWPQGHAPTNYTIWAHNTTTCPYTVPWQQDFEPYIVAKASVLPFDARFVCRVRNKVSHNEELHMAGYRFVVVHNSFIIHLPHPPVKETSYPFKCFMNRYYEWRKEKQKQYLS